MRSIRIVRLFFMVMALGSFCLAPKPGFAAASHPHHHKHHQHHYHHHHHRHHQALQSSTPHFSELVVDGDTGRVLFAKNAGALRYPASLTKMMTLYLTFDALKKGKLRMDQTIMVSAKAASQPQTNISLYPGARLPVRIAIESIVVRSANDSAMALGEALGKTEWNFALMMTRKAHELGMRDTVFRNPNGLPDSRQHTTAFDMARLAIALRRDFPEYYHFFSLEKFTYDGVTYPGHNHVMQHHPDMVDGVKTGYIRASGYNLVTSAHHDGHNLVAVIMGGRTSASRDSQMVSLLYRTFNNLENHNKTSISSKSSSIDEGEKLEANDVMPLQTAQGD